MNKVKYPIRIILFSKRYYSNQNGHINNSKICDIDSMNNFEDRIKNIEVKLKNVEIQNINIQDTINYIFIFQGVTYMLMCCIFAKLCMK